MVKRGEGRLPRLLHFGTDLSSQSSSAQPHIASSAKDAWAYLPLRGSDTVPLGLRTAVPVVTYFPVEAERCGPLGGDLPAIPFSNTDTTRPYPALALNTVICQIGFRKAYLVEKTTCNTSSSGHRERTLRFLALNGSNWGLAASETF